MNVTRTARATLLALTLLSLAPAGMAEVPDWVNYQGILRDSAGVPRNGSFDMRFRFFDAPVGGNEILVDSHLAAGTGAVPVYDGLFEVWLGSGVVTDGSAVLPGDPYTSLTEMFRHFGAAGFDNVWVQIEITGEVLSPRIAINSVPYAHKAQYASYASEATTLQGLAAGNFIDTSGSFQTKAGALRVDGALIAGGALSFAFPGATVRAFADQLAVVGGDSPTDDLMLQSGLSTDGRSGGIFIFGEEQMHLQAGNGNFNFSNGATGLFTGFLDFNGTFTAVGDLVAQGNDLRFGAPGALISASAGQLLLLAGDADTDDLFLYAGNDFTDGGIEVAGDSQINFRSGNGLFQFLNGGSVTPIVTIQPTGAVSTVDDLTVGGHDVFLGFPGARLTGSDTSVELAAGDLSSDDLFLSAGDDPTDGGVDILGDSTMTLRAGNGAFQFVNGATSTVLATLSSVGLLSTLGDVQVGGDDVRFGSALSARISRNTTFDDVVIARDEDNNSNAWFQIFTNGGTIEQLRIEDGDEASALFDGPATSNGIDYAEAFWITDPTLVAGEVVVFDKSRPGFVARASEPYSALAAGVISEKPGFVTGGSFAAEEAADPALAGELRAARHAGDHGKAREISVELGRKRKEQQRPVALAGRLPVKVDATYGEIHAGDHLTSSATPGHAMAMNEAGPSIGVALESFRGPGTGVVLAFVERGHYTPPALVQELARSVDARTPDPASGVQVLPSNLQLVLDGSGGQDSRFSIFRDGKAQEPHAEVFRVDERGNVWAQGAFRPRSMDLAETFAVSETVEPGDVLSVDREHAGNYVRSRQAGDRAVVGVVATDPGVLLGGDVSRVLGESPELALALEDARTRLDGAAEQAVWAELERRFRAGHAPVALSGTVPVKVDAGYGAIEPGDLLISSPTPGHAMRAADPVPAGAVIGKALESIAAGTGTIRMIVMLR